MLQKSTVYGAQPLELNIYGELGNEFKWTPDNIAYWLTMWVMTLLVRDMLIKSYANIIFKDLVYMNQTVKRCIENYS